MGTERKREGRKAGRDGESYNYIQEVDRGEPEIHSHFLLHTEFKTSMARMRPSQKQKEDRNTIEVWTVQGAQLRRVLGD